MKKLSEDTNRLADTLESAECAFWGVMTKDYPEVKTGDVSFDVAIDLSEAMKKAAVHWLDTNQEEDNCSGTVEVLFHNIEYSFSNPNQDIGDHVEQIAYEITNGSKSGELFFTDFANDGGERTVVGEWEINNG